MSTNAICADMDTAAYLHGTLSLSRTVPLWPCPRIVFPSGATGNLTVEWLSPTRAVVMATTHYQPDPTETHAEDVARIRAAVDALNASVPARFGRPLVTVTATLQRHQQYELTKEDADWIRGVIHAVCPVVKRWVGNGGGGERCISHEVDPSAITAHPQSEAGR